jgi:hypothetical protein
MINLWPRLSLIAAFLLPPLSLFSQVVPSGTMSPSGAIFAQGGVTTLESNAGHAQYGNLLYGGNIGAYFQFRPWLGIDARVLLLESRSQTGHEEHQRAAFAGPRFTFSRRRFTMYGIALAGISHADYVSSPIRQYPNGEDVLTAATDPAIQAGGGIDLRINRRLYWRLGEVTYSHMFVPVPAGTVGPDAFKGTNFSTGLVLKISL